MKIALLSIFLLFSTNTKVPIEKEHIGTFEVYINNQDEVEVRYTGKYDKCFSLYLIKRIYPDCDSLIDIERLDSIFQLTIIEPDTCFPIKTTRM